MRMRNVLEDERFAAEAFLRGFSKTLCWVPVCSTPNTRPRLIASARRSGLSSSKSFVASPP